MNEDILKYKLCFSKHITDKEDYTNKLNNLYTKIFTQLQVKYKNVYNLLRSSLIFYLFLIPEDILIKSTVDQIKSFFTLENIVNNSTDIQDGAFLAEDPVNESYIVEETNHLTQTYNFVSINTNINLLEYHPLVLNNIENKNKIMRKILNKLVMAIKLDLFGGSKYIDYYKEIEDSLYKTSETKNKNEINTKTTRGGIKKKIKMLKKFRSA
ncbi:hypothetical protein P3W45_000464 [Vairimorpha bombi]|jgi:hypothetical protein